MSSKPTQTTVSSSGVKPTNQASRRSFVVPRLAGGVEREAGGARAGAGALVEHAAHHVRDEERRVGARDALRAPALARTNVVVAGLDALESLAAAGRCRRWEQRVGLRHFERRQLEHAERDRRERLRRRADADPPPERGDVVEANRSPT